VIHPKSFDRIGQVTRPSLKRIALVLHEQADECGAATAEATLSWLSDDEPGTEGMYEAQVIVRVRKIGPAD
jgi:hypothetical protein